MEIRELIQQAYEDCISDKGMSRETMIKLIDLDPESGDADYLRELGGKAAQEITGGEACLWGAIGVDMITCGMNCRFCSFGAEWGVVKENTIFTDEEIIANVCDYVKNGVRFIVLRTTEFYDIDDLCRKISRIREEVPGNYEMILNTGEFTLDIARQMADAGTSGVYHALRLREGIDTNLDPRERLDTMKSVQESPLKLISLVEPVGREHTSEEIADAFFITLDHDAYMTGTMARVPVKGTPLGEIEMITDKRISQLTAIFRLAAQRKIKYICVHPASDIAVRAGANIVVVEKGAIPRDSAFERNEWNSFTVDDAKAMLEAAGYTWIRTE